MNRNISLITRARYITWLFGILTFITVLSVFGVSEYTQIREHIAMNMTGTAESLTGLINEHFFAQVPVVKRVVSSVPKGDDYTVAIYLKINLPTQDPKDVWVLLNHQRRIISGKGLDLSQYTGLDLSHLDYVAKMEPVSRIHQSFFNNRPVITFLYKLPQDRLLLMDRDLEALKPLASSVRVPSIRKFIFFILSSHGTVIYHPNNEYVKTRRNLGFEIRNLRGPDEMGLFTYTFMGKDYWCYKKALAMPLGWTFYASVPESEVFSEIWSKSLPILISVAFLFLFTMPLFDVFLRRHFSEPVSRIYNSLRELDPISSKEKLPEEMGASIIELTAIIKAINGLLDSVRTAHEQVLRNEELFRTVTDFASDWTYWLGSDGKFLYISPACEHITGYSPVELYNDPSLVKRMVDRRDRAAYEAHLKESVQAKPHKPIEFRIITKNGQKRWIGHTCRAIYDKQGNFLGVRGSNADITWKKQAEERISRERQRLAVTLKSIGDAVVTTDLDGHIQMMNHVAEHLTGWKEAEAKGRGIEEVFHFINPKTGRACEGPVENVLRDGTLVKPSSNPILVSRGGEKRIVSTSGAPIKNHREDIIGVVLTVRDVTDEVRREDERAKIEKLESLGIAAGGIAHDFNNLLTAILGNISLAKMQTVPTSPVYARLESAELASVRAQGLTRQLLTFAKGGAPVKELTDLGNLIRETARFSLRGTKSFVEFDIPGDLWSAEVDPGQISQVVQNIIINAEQAMPNGGKVSIKASNVVLSTKDLKKGQILSPGRYISISIRDQGPGIRKEDLGRIFDPYFTTKEKGSGLGLAVCFSIIRRHNGHIGVQSSPGNGAVFTIFLPAKEQIGAGEYEKKKGGSASPWSQKGKRVLIMDDEKAVRDLAGDALKFLGYRPDFASNGQEAIQKYRAALFGDEPFAAVITDLTIVGGMGGKEAVEEIMKIDSDAVVIVSSGYANDEIMENFRQFGFKAVLPKPYRLENLKAVLQEAIPFD